ncbi:hypothetical protein CONPUDRAFT_77581 [Coniophora puteana RWD-64-598 SS2]|uniref:Uncharacterized protein n=1 Tax=Coniophora puteana (strain RWD-64-598) TaxID=741705 RepID=A0A5M3M7T8_CONPW|nr:uncharacterized protein CONPUDRAFT_77581 [Coniophora puteana RWD-64-598 SS2]EIW74731.1 hypothetical protein CONPUDRAFT_77581 [Coniophora puteana RWD-64-598 SS2]
MDYDELGSPTDAPEEPRSVDKGKKPAISLGIGGQAPNFAELAKYGEDDDMGPIVMALDNDDDLDAAFANIAKRMGNAPAGEAVPSAGKNKTNNTATSAAPSTSDGPSADPATMDAEMSVDKKAGKAKAVHSTKPKQKVVPGKTSDPEAAPSSTAASTSRAAVSSPGPQREPQGDSTSGKRKASSPVHANPIAKRPAVGSAGGERNTLTIPLGAQSVPGAGDRKSRSKDLSSADDESAAMRDFHRQTDYLLRFVTPSAIVDFLQSAENAFGNDLVRGFDVVGEQVVGRAEQAADSGQGTSFTTPISADAGAAHIISLNLRPIRPCLLGHQLMAFVRSQSPGAVEPHPPTLMVYHPPAAHPPILLVSLH